MPLRHEKESWRAGQPTASRCGQSLAATGPSIAIAGTVAVIYLTAGRGTIWSYVLATVVVVLVGYSIAQFARRTAAAGSLYSYTASGLGRGAAFAGGWGLVFGYQELETADLESRIAAELTL